MIQNKVYKLKKETIISEGIILPESQEIEIVTDVVYVNGYMVPPNLQPTFYNWIVNNPELFDDATKNW
jgi:hypothetical protein